MKRGSMRCKIPEDMREQLAADPFMQECIIDIDPCDGRIEWNHGMQYAGRRVNELYTLLPMCHKHHDKEARYRKEINAAVAFRIFYFELEDQFRERYPKSTLI